MKEEEEVVNVETPGREPDADQPRDLLGAGILRLGLDHQDARCARDVSRLRHGAIVFQNCEAPSAARPNNEAMEEGKFCPGPPFLFIQ